MNTNQRYKKLLENRCLAPDMVADAIYSINKRAKNYRDRGEYAFRYKFSRMDYSQQPYKMMEKYYEIKNEFLNHFEPICIHRQQLENLKTGNIYYKFYLYFEIGKGQFHQPIDKKQLKKYSNLEVLDIDSDFYTEGADISNLMSVQFAKKVLDLLQSKQFEWIED